MIVRLGLTPREHLSPRLTHELLNKARKNSKVQINNHSGLLQTIVNYECEKFHNVAPCRVGTTIQQRNRNKGYT
jgi:hypothetical protein